MSLLHLLLDDVTLWLREGSTIHHIEVVAVGRWDVSHGEDLGQRLLDVADAIHDSTSLRLVFLGRYAIGHDAPRFLHLLIIRSHQGIVLLLQLVGCTFGLDDRAHLWVVGDGEVDVGVFQEEVCHRSILAIVDRKDKASSSSIEITREFELAVLDGGRVSRNHTEEALHLTKEYSVSLLHSSSCTRNVVTVGCTHCQPRQSQASSNY